MLKAKLDNLVLQYETVDFIDADPIRFPHQYINKQDIELAAFIASCFAYGKRDAFISKLDSFFSQVDINLLDFIKKYNENKENVSLFDYRFSTADDFDSLLTILSNLYDKSSLEELFQSSYLQSGSVLGMLENVVNYFYSACDDLTHGFCHFLPHPKKGSAMKRLNMFLRWMVRKGDVDFGVWSFIDKSELLIPLDVHVARISRHLGLLKRNANDIKSVVELTNSLKYFCPEDPVRYDFALFGYGVNNSSL